MKVHDEIESLTDVYLAGGLEAAERAEIEEHAVSCGACAAVLRDAKEFHGWVSGSSASGAPPTGLEDRVIANLRASTHRRAPKLIRFLAGVAAVFAFIVIGGIFSNSGEMAEIQNKLAGAIAYDEKAGHDPKFIRHSSEIDGYAGDTAFATELKAGWGYESSGSLALPKPGQETKDKNTEYLSRSIGGGGGAGERMRQSLKNMADAGKPAAPSTAAPPQEYAEESDRNESADMAPEKKAGEELRKESGKGPGEPAPVVDDRKIIRNADLHLEVEKYDDAYKSIGEITRAKKGFIAGASTTRLANGKIRATVTLRIPPDKFEETLTELGKLGTVRHQAISTADVTKQYQDLESRLKSKETLVERLKKVLLEGKGTVKELMEVEVQMGATIEQIESIKGELKYFDNLVGLSTITMQVFEKDLGLPFEYVQTLQSVIGVTAFDADAAYAAAQKVILDAGGQVVESRMTRANEDSASGFVKGKVDADKFPAVRDSLKKLGKRVDQDTVNQQQTGRGGRGDAKPGAPVKKEQAVIDFTVNMPPIMVTKQARIGLESPGAKSVYEEARRAIEAEKDGKIVGGSLSDRTDGAKAFVRGQVAAESFQGLVEKLKTLGVVKSATVEQIVQGDPQAGGPPIVRERGEIILEIATPPQLLTEEHGIGRAIRETFAKSLAGILWSIEKLFVGIALAGPWIVLAILAILVWRRARRPKPA